MLHQILILIPSRPSYRYYSFNSFDWSISSKFFLSPVLVNSDFKKAKKFFCKSHNQEYTSKQNTQRILSIQQEENRNVSAKKMWVATKKMIKCSASSTVRNIQVKVMKGDHHASIRMTKRNDWQQQVLMKIRSNGNPRVAAVESKTGAATLDMAWQGLPPELTYVIY